MSSNSALRTIYRALTRYNRQLSECGDTLTVRAPLDTFAYQRQQPTWTVNDAGSRQDIVEQLLPNIVQIPKTGVFTPEALRACIRANFRHDNSTSVVPHGDILDNAFAALRILSEQMHMQQCSSHTITQGISVDVTSAYLDKVPLGAGEAYSFTYRVRITNLGNSRTQLLSRKWVIKDAEGETANEVKGPGVIGNTPILRPYDCFEYYSAAFSKTKTGTMGGSFEMLNLDVHERFNALIEPFRLVAR